ncbi:AarF/UbiB family protein [Robbsia sp. Bb-Pol-6]|uniref:AarF/UbiB family protein n=1 Tax=Robbsia betulipollinis TaxID=2981849 RepID=A0ABT3ZLG8_9BURK|nr:AarF/UbiB family protein [Robbsia betulipollinis]MCY0386793.1 AarF/UbiB family protein [Robbsia betulipollinis]
MRRLATLWRLGALFVTASRGAPHGGPLQGVLRSLAMQSRRREAMASTASAPPLHHLSGVVALAARALERHPALAEAAVRVAFAEMGALSEPYAPEATRAALQRALPGPRFQDIAALSAAPVRCGIAEQTHSARLGAAPVSITLLRMDIRAHLADDLDLAERAARFAQYRSRRARASGLRAWVVTLRGSIHAMLDLRQRAADQSFLRYKLRDDARVLVPEVLWDYCNETVLTTRAVRHVPVTDAAALRAAGLDPAALIAVLIECFFEISMGAGMVHAGLDAAGARVSVEADTLGRLVLDAETPMLFMAAHERGFLVTAADALLRGDHKTAAREHFEQGRPARPHPAHEVMVETTYRRAAERFATPEARRGTSVAALLTALGQGTLEHAFSDTHIRIASRAALLSRSVAAIESMAARLAPDLDVWDIVRRVLARLMADQFTAHGLVAQMTQEVMRWPHTLPRVPRLLAQQLSAAAARQRSLSGSASANAGPGRGSAAHPE